MQMQSFNSEERRKACWSARDLFLACLMQNSSPNGLYEALKAQPPATEIIPDSIVAPCKELQKAMYSSCPQSWVKLCIIRNVLQF